MPSRRSHGKKQQPRPRRGLAKAMEQAGVAWDEREATRIRREVKSEPAQTQRREDIHLPERNQPAITTDWMPLSALIGTVGAGGFGYFVGESTMAPYPHPSHWIAAAMAGFLGYLGGFMWHRMRGF